MPDHTRQDSRETPVSDILIIDDVAKTYRARDGSKVAVLNQVSLSIEPGQFKVVHGASGSGKTTLLLAAGGLLRPDSGSVQVCGTDLYALSQEKRSRFRGAHIGFVFQQFHLIPYLNVLENVLAPTLAVADAEARARAVELVDLLGLSHRLKHPPADLSTGERQRVALARALLNQPKLVLADEPTGNLDAANAAIVIGHLREFTRRGGAVLLATHDDRIEAVERYELVQGALQENSSTVSPAAT